MLFSLCFVLYVCSTICIISRALSNADEWQGAEKGRRETATRCRPRRCQQQQQKEATTEVEANGKGRAVAGVAVAKEEQQSVCQSSTTADHLLATCLCLLQIGEHSNLVARHSIYRLLIFFLYSLSSCPLCSLSCPHLLTTTTNSVPFRVLTCAAPAWKLPGTALKTTSNTEQVKSPG